jgi:hypothetical protein
MTDTASLMQYLLPILLKIYRGIDAMQLHFTTSLTCSLLQIWRKRYYKVLCTVDICFTTKMTWALLHSWCRFYYQFDTILLGQCGCYCCCTIDASFTANLTRFTTMLALLLLYSWRYTYCNVKATFVASLTWALLQSWHDRYFKVDATFIANWMRSLLQTWHDNTDLTCNFLHIWCEIIRTLDAIFTTQLVRV